MDSLSDDMDEMLHHYETRAAALREEIEARQKDLDRIEQRLITARETRVMLTEWRQVQEVGAPLPRAESQTAPATPGAGPRAQSGMQPTIQQMILQTLEAHGQPMTLAMLYEACQRHGWTVKRHSLSATFSKLLQDRRVTRDEEGRAYTLPR